MKFRRLSCTCYVGSFSIFHTSYSDSEENGDVKKEKKTYLQTENLRSSSESIRNRDYRDSDEESMCIHTSRKTMKYIHYMCLL